MSRPEQLDVLIFGGGTGAKLAAWTLAKAGRRTATVERQWVGGSCPNVNCLPSKNEVRSAEVADIVRRAGAFGTLVTGARVDMAQVLARKRKMVEGLVAVYLEQYRASGAELIMGEGHFVAAKTLEVATTGGGKRLLRGDQVILDLGTRAFVPPIPGLAAAAMTNIEMLELSRLPERLFVLGGGYVGLEFAQAYRRFGSRVTVVERGPQLLSREDPDFAEALLRLFADEEIEVLLNTPTLRVEGERGAFRVVVHTSKGERTIPATDILVATGRIQNTTGIGLDVAGVKLNGRGYIAVDDRLETSVPGVWAIGDCTGGPQFTHVCENDFRIVVENLDGGNRTTRGRVVPFCVYTDPPLARVGYNEVEARARGVPVRVVKLPVAEVRRTWTTGDMRGFMKGLVHAQRDDILGFTMFGADAGEVMAVVQTAMMAGLPYRRLDGAMFAHPTMAEGLSRLFSLV